MEGKKQILVTDDESGVRESFRMVFKDSYEVLTADCGRECLRMAEQSRPELVILDVRLPDMNGLDVFKELRKIDAALPVIVITGIGTHQTAIDALKLGALDFLAKPIDFHNLRTAVDNVLSAQDKGVKGLPSIEDIITKNYLSTLKVLNKILEARDPYTREHSRRVSEYSVIIAKNLALSEDEQEVMRQTALLHDIGKIGIAEAILNKQDKLTPEEWIEIQKHTLIGAAILEPLKVLHIEQSMIRHHHERYDGKGYPDHLKGEEIPLYARILAVADAYDSMVNGRTYRCAFSPIESIAELERCNGTQFDPEIVKVFVKALSSDERFLRKVKEQDDEL